MSGDDFHPSAVRIRPGLRWGLPAFHWEHDGRWGWASTPQECIGQALLAHESNGCDLGQPKERQEEQ